jgi:hypothetical protein
VLVQGKRSIAATSDGWEERRIGIRSFSTVETWTAGDGLALIFFLFPFFLFPPESRKK